MVLWSSRGSLQSDCLKTGCVVYFKKVKRFPQLRLGSFFVRLCIVTAGLTVLHYFVLPYFSPTNGLRLVTGIYAPAVALFAICVILLKWEYIFLHKVAQRKKKTKYGFFKSKRDWDIFSLHLAWNAAYLWLPISLFLAILAAYEVESCKTGKFDYCFNMPDRLWKFFPREFMLVYIMGVFIVPILNWLTAPFTIEEQKEDADV